MIDSKNDSSSSMKNLAPDPFLIEYGNKYVELRITKDAISMYRDSFLENKKILEEEKRELVINQLIKFCLNNFKFFFKYL